MLGRVIAFSLVLVGSVFLIALFILIVAGA